MSDIVPLAADDLKAMDQFCHNTRFQLILRKNQLFGAVLPSLGQELVVQLRDLDQLGPVLAAAKQRVLEVDDLLPVQESLLGRLRPDGGLDARVEAGDAVLLVDLDGQLQSGGADGLALDPADFLEDEYGLLVIGKRLVLFFDALMVLLCIITERVSSCLSSLRPPPCQPVYLLNRQGEIEAFLHSRLYAGRMLRLTKEYFPLRFFSVISAGAAMFTSASVVSVGGSRVMSGKADSGQLVGVRKSIFRTRQPLI